MINLAIGFRLSGIVPYPGSRIDALRKQLAETREHMGTAPRLNERRARPIELGPRRSRWSRRWRLCCPRQRGIQINRQQQRQLRRVISCQLPRQRPRLGVSGGDRRARLLAVITLGQPLEQPRHGRVGGDRPVQLPAPRSTAMSAAQPPPSPSATTRSRAIFPGSWTEPSSRHDASALPSAAARPLTRAVSPAARRRPAPRHPGHPPSLRSSSRRR